MIARFYVEMWGSTRLSRSLCPDILNYAVLAEAFHKSARSYRYHISKVLGYNMRAMGVTDLGEQSNWARKMMPSKLVKLYTAFPNLGSLESRLD